MERLNKVIANSGYTSRRKADQLIKEGKVSVNGDVIREMGTLVKKGDEIIVEGNILFKESKVYYLLYKPESVVSTANDDKGRKTVVDLINTDKRIYPIGRLDYDTTGAILLTNDGEFANLLSHPSKKVEKVYRVKIDGIIKAVDIKKLEAGVMIDGIKTAKARVKLKSYNKKNNTSILLLTIHEGRNHQVKKMFKAVGFNVVKLKRESIAFFTLETLKPGEYRPLSIKEVKTVYGLLQNKND